MYKEQKIIIKKQGNVSLSQEKKKKEVESNYNQKRFDIFRATTRNNICHY